MRPKARFAVDARLKMCAELVREGARIADIGTDHALLPVWLCRSGKCPSAVAADINPEPLKRGAETIAAAGLENKIKTRLCDGLNGIFPGEADDIVIAGMGGELIAKIISESRFSHDASKRFILQPMTKSEELVKWLCENGFEVLRQSCCVSGGKCYTALLAEYTGGESVRGELYYYLCELKPKENAEQLLFIKGHIERLMKKSNADPRFAALAEELKLACGGSYDNN